jgi:DNA-directed RNA polymerase subunit beta'
VLLNRAPTLHRLGIQAFEPVLIEGKAIQLHPLVCAAFNADFDGDQMAVHVPLSLEAQLEARVLMMSTNNVLSPANGKPIIVPSQDMILGLYYLSLEKPGEPNEGMMLADQAEIEHAMHAGLINLHTKIITRFHTVDEDGNDIVRRVETTPGRMLLANLLPKNAKVPFEIVNQVMRKREVGEVIDTVYRHSGQKESVIFCDKIMSLGFTEAFKAGISFGKDDMVIPANKWEIVNGTRALAKEFEKQYQDGLITQGEKYNKVVDAWSKCTDRVSDAMMEEIKAVQVDPKTGRLKEMNSVYMMSHSGARGSPTQMRQLSAMRGLMAKPSGEIIETPIISNFKEGLTVLEYFNSTHGARKGLADTALKTANSGYLTRRLVDVAQDCIIKLEDCGTELGITAEAVVDGGTVIATIGEQVLGRVPLEDILDPATGEVIHKRGVMIEEREAALIDEAQVQSIKIRSPLTCEAEDGICTQCYGRDLARGTQVNVGEAVGIIAAQSIGEPGTQLTMRTFHIGGAANVADQSFLESTQEGKVSFRNANTLKNSDREIVVMARNMQLAIVDDQGRERAIHKLAYGSKLLVNEGDPVKRGQRLAEWDPYTLPIIAERGGVAKFVDLELGFSLREETDDATGISQRIVSDWRSAPKANELKPAITLVDAKGNMVKLDNGNPAHYFMSVDAILSVEDGQQIKGGEVIARIPREGAKTKDITGGLPRVAELFEARRPKDHAIIAEIDGTVRFAKDYKNKRRITIEPLDESEETREYLIPKGKHIAVQEGDVITKGEYIMDGNPAPHDILAILGVEALAKYLTNEIQEVYRLQGVKINDKHIEVVVRQMLQKIEITNSGETTLLAGEHVDRAEFDEINAKAVAEGRRPAQGVRILLGITKASLQTRSFISAASFQETTRVLTEAATQGKRDRLVGLKENVIVGRLIPAGTGRATTRIKQVAAARDKAVLAEREAAAAAAAAALEVIDVSEEKAGMVPETVGTGFDEIL